MRTDEFESHRKEVETVTWDDNDVKWTLEIREVPGASE